MGLVDAHCHLDFMANGEEVARDAADAGAVLFANTVTPDGYEAARARFGELANVRVGLGLHPWWVRAGSDAERVVELIEGTRFVGEVGLDFGWRHVGAREAQMVAFYQIVRACSEAGGKVLSIHAVRAAREAIDLLAQSGATASCTCVFHWFSGPSDQLKRAIDLGCYFSVNARMLATRRGPEYVKAIPVGRLLLESDAPPSEGEPYSWEALHAELQATGDEVARIKGSGAWHALEANARQIFCGV